MAHKRAIDPNRFKKPKKRTLSVPPRVTVHNLDKMSLEEL